MQTMIGVIGGSGVYQIDGLEGASWVRVKTPWGKPSDEVLVGRLAGVPMAFLPRHGRGHVHSPSSVPYRANIDALKRLGCTDVIAVSAVGSLRADYAPGDFVIVDQYIDRTFAREKSFFGPGCVGHVSLAHPTCPRLSDACAEAGTDYLDLCGEPGWMAAMIPRLTPTAQASGARIVFSCGFDSIPFDLGVVFLQDAALQRFGRRQALARDAGSDIAPAVLELLDAIGLRDAVVAVTKADLGIAKQFVCISYSSNSLVFSPAMIWTGAQQTVAVASGVTDLNTKAITGVGTAATGYRQNMVFHQNAFALVTVPLVKPPGAVDVGRETYKGTTVRVIPVYDGINDESMWRLHVLYGVKAVDPRLATRISGTA